ncbi:hypothetical protein ACS0TY_016049 [Phlomoides rotata]
MGCMRNSVSDLIVLSTFGIARRPPKALTIRCIKWQRRPLQFMEVNVDRLQFRGCFSMNHEKGFAFEAELATAFHTIDFMMQKRVQRRMISVDFLNRNTGLVLTWYQSLLSSRCCARPDEPPQYPRPAPAPPSRRHAQALPHPRAATPLHRRLATPFPSPQLLLERGYTVKATVRNLNDPKKVGHLRALDGAGERLHLFEAELLEDGSFDPAVDGCEGVFHTDAPCLLTYTDPQAELIEPAVKGTLNVLRSCRKVPTVRRVVLTSSIVTVLCNRNTKGPDVVVDETLFSDKGFCEEEKLWYAIPKIMAEEAAWKFAEENGSDLVVMMSGLVIGPVLHPSLNLSTAVFLDIIKGAGAKSNNRLVHT